MLKTLNLYDPHRCYLLYSIDDSPLLSISDWNYICHYNVLHVLQEEARYVVHCVCVPLQLSFYL